MSAHGLFLGVLVGGAVVRWITMVGYPGVLWFTGDSYFYLGYSFRLAPSPSKTMGYPFLLHLLEPAHSLALVAGLQHAMGLSIAVMVYALLRRAGLPGWGATLCTLPILYDAYTIQLEHLLMSETLYTFLIALALTLLLWRIRGERRRSLVRYLLDRRHGGSEERPPEEAKSRGPAWWMAVAAGLLLGYAVLVRSAAAPLVPVVFLGLLLRRGGWWHAPLFAVAAAIPIVWYAMWFHDVRGFYGLTSSDGIYLWGRTSSFADCAKIKPPSHMEALCLDPELRAEGYPPGRLIWRKEAPPRILYESVTSQETNAILRDFSIRAIRAQPRDYFDTVADGVGKAFSPNRFPVPSANTESLYHFSNQPQPFPGGASWGGENSTAYSDAVRYEQSYNVSQVVQPQADRMVSYEKRVHLPGPALGVMFVVGAGGLLVSRDRRAALLVWTSAATLLVFPIASADFDYRYVVPVIPFACLAVGMAFTRPFTRSQRRPRPAEATVEAAAPEEQDEQKEQEDEAKPKEVAFSAGD